MNDELDYFDFEDFMKPSYYLELMDDETEYDRDENIYPAMGV